MNQHWDLIIAAVKCLDAKAMVLRFGKHVSCMKYIEFWRYPVMSFLYLDKDDLERADDQ